jgi:hypothetical protein
VAIYVDQYLGVLTDKTFDDFFKQTDVNQDGKLNYGGEYKTVFLPYFTVGLPFAKQRFVFSKGI